MTKIVTVHQDGTTSEVDMPAQLVHLITLRSAIKLQIKTGMKWSKGSLLTVAQRCGYTEKRTLKGAFADINKLIIERGGESKSLEGE